MQRGKPDLHWEHSVNWSNPFPWCWASAPTPALPHLVLCFFLMKKVMGSSDRGASTSHLVWPFISFFFHSVVFIVNAITFSSIFCCGHWLHLLLQAVIKTLEQEHVNHISYLHTFAWHTIRNHSEISIACCCMSLYPMAEFWRSSLILL